MKNFFLTIKKQSKEPINVFAFFAMVLVSIEYANDIYYVVSLYLSNSITLYTVFSYIFKNLNPLIILMIWLSQFRFNEPINTKK